MLFPVILKSIVRTGSLRLIDGAGSTHMYGDGSPPHCTVRLRARHLDYTLALNPELSIGEAYMNGLLTIEDGTLYDVLEIAARNFRNFEKMPWFSLLSRMMRGLKPLTVQETAIQELNPLDRRPARRCRLDARSHNVRDIETAAEGGRQMREVAAHPDTLMDSL